MKSNTKKILIIDDEAYIRRVLKLKLERRGYQIITAVNGEEGLNCFNTHQPDIVITDIQMPKMNGLVFCERTNDLKKARPFLTIIITCSILDIKSTWLDKMDDTLFFEKPFSPSKLLDCIEKYIGIE